MTGAEHLLRSGTVCRHYVALQAPSLVGELDLNGATIQVRPLARLQGPR